MFKERMLYSTLMCQVKGHHAKMARTKTNKQNNTKKLEHQNATGI